MLRSARSARLEALAALALLLCQGCIQGYPPEAVDAPGFERRAPLAGQPGYLETIRFINDGVRYLEPRAAFAVSPEGDLCFRGAQEVSFVRLANYKSFWCMAPTAVAAVEALDDDVTHVPSVRLWCRHDAPYCAWRVKRLARFGAYGRADAIMVQIVPYRREKAAIEHLVYLMGGSTVANLSAGLDSGPFVSSVRTPTGNWENPR
jgi:hypothetical protein